MTLTTATNKDHDDIHLHTVPTVSFNGIPINYLPVDILIAKGEIKEVLEAYNITTLDPQDSIVKDHKTIRLVRPDNGYESLVFGYDPETEYIQGFFTLNHDHEMAEMAVLMLNDAVQHYGLRLDKQWEVKPLGECDSYIKSRSIN